MSTLSSPTCPVNIPPSGIVEISIPCVRSGPVRSVFVAIFVHRALHARALQIATLPKNRDVEILSAGLERESSRNVAAEVAHWSRHFSCSASAHDHNVGA